MKPFNEVTTIEKLTERGKNTLGEYLGMEYVEVGEKHLIAKMPVDHRTKQPYGLLHGGASAAFAETLGSVCASLSVAEGQGIVGLELNINHIKSAREGYVYGKCAPIHRGASTHVWNIEIRNEHDKLISISRLTTMVIKAR